MHALPKFANSKVNRHEFDLLQRPQKTRIAMRRAAISDIAPTVRLVGAAIDGVSVDCAAIERVISTNPNNILLFVREGKIVGTWSQLMLSSKGLEALLTGELDTRTPHEAFLARSAEAPAAIYVWAVAAKGLAVDGIRYVSGFLSQPIYCHANLYARPVTAQGQQLSRTLGFETLGSSALWRYVRRANQYIEEAA